MPRCVRFYFILRRLGQTRREALGMTIYNFLARWNLI